MVTKAMTLWMNRAVPGQPVYPEGQGAPVGGDWIGLWLLGLEPSPSTADLATRPYRLTMTYRLQPMTADPLTAHERLCDLMFAAMTNPWLEQDPDATTRVCAPIEIVPAATARDRYSAQTLGASLYLDVTIERPRPLIETQLVREPAILRTRSIN